MASRIRLEQILVNLLQNALDALKGQPDPRIAIALAERDDRIAITVRDNGPGLAPEAGANLFMPFQTSKEKGLGLGLVHLARDRTRARRFAAVRSGHGQGRIVHGRA